MTSKPKNGKEPATEASDAATAASQPPPFLFGQTTVAAEASTSKLSQQGVGGSATASSCPTPLDAQESTSAKATKLAQNEYLLTGNVSSGTQIQQKLEKTVSQKTFGLFFGEDLPQWFKDCRVTSNSLVMNTKLYSDSLKQFVNVQRYVATPVMAARRCAETYAKQYLRPGIDLFKFVSGEAPIRRIVNRFFIENPGLLEE
eukprot:SAG11_NODE_2376_length_3440_cov_2.320862_1_plen_201_part_00